MTTGAHGYQPHQVEENQQSALFSTSLGLGSSGKFFAMLGILLQLTLTHSTCNMCSLIKLGSAALGVLVPSGNRGTSCHSVSACVERPL